ncbi:MAG: helix-turn-helix domain-containing protein [Oscillospiraceae bacterium]|jgi:ribosome-binding protein aMBF1 (putative translation factor)|nr:helix-turn-helix domain-containing protein [Oscillospiraceae bacterium]
MATKKTACEWQELRESFNLTPEEETAIALEKAIIEAVISAREKSGLTQKQLSDICGVKQPVISRLEKAVHSPQINSMIKILKPLGYTLAIVPDGSQQNMQVSGK